MNRNNEDKDLGNNNKSEDLSDGRKVCLEPFVGMVGPSFTTAEVIEVEGRVCYGRVKSL